MSNQQKDLVLVARHQGLESTFHRAEQWHYPCEYCGLVLRAFALETSVGCEWPSGVGNDRMYNAKLGELCPSVLSVVE